VNVPQRQDDRSCGCAMRLPLLRILLLFVIFFCLAGCDPGRSKTLSIGLPEHQTSGISIAGSESNTVATVLSTVRQVATMQGMWESNERGDELTRSDQRFPVYVKARDKGPGSITIRLEFGEDRKTLLVSVMEFPSTSFSATAETLQKQLLLELRRALDDGKADTRVVESQ